VAAWKSPYTIRLSGPEREVLEARSRHRSSQHRDYVRSNIILLAAEGLDNKAVAARIGVDRKTVSRWRKRFFEERLSGLDERPRSGRPRRFSP
jgi:transposase